MGKAEIGLMWGLEEGILSQQHPPSQGSGHCVLQPPTAIWRVFLNVLHLKGLLRIMERTRMMPGLRHPDGGERRLPQNRAGCSANSGERWEGFILRPQNAGSSGSHLAPS